MPKRRIMGVFVNASRRKAEPDWFEEERRNHPLRYTRANARRLTEKELQRDEKKGGTYAARARMFRAQYAQQDAAIVASEAAVKKARLAELNDELEE